MIVVLGTFMVRPTPMFELRAGLNKRPPEGREGATRRASPLIPGQGAGMAMQLRARSGQLQTEALPIASYSPDALIISLGVDTYKDDPISFFKLESDDFRTYGTRIAKLDLPTLFVMEGGYAVAEIGINTVNVLQGFEDV